MIGLLCEPCHFMICRFVLAGLTKAAQHKIIKWAGATNMIDPGFFCEPCHTILII